MRGIETQWHPFAIVLDPEELNSFRLVTGASAMFFATVAERTTDAIRKIINHTEKE